MQQAGELVWWMGVPVLVEAVMVAVVVERARAGANACARPKSQPSHLRRRVSVRPARARRGLRGCRRAEVARPLGDGSERVEVRALRRRRFAGDRGAVSWTRRRRGSWTP